MAPSNCCFSTKSRAQQQAAPHCICSTLHTTRSTAASHALLAGILFLSGWHMRMILELPTHISSITHSTRSHRAQNWPLTQAHRATSACACLLVRVYARKSGVRVALTTTFQNTFGSLLSFVRRARGAGHDCRWYQYRRSLSLGCCSSHRRQCGTYCLSSEGEVQSCLSCCAFRTNSVCLSFSFPFLFPPPIPQNVNQSSPRFFGLFSCCF